jgi:O-antigen/teichoic acid export membrane protein
MLIPRLKQLSKDSIIYGLGSIAAKSITFFLIPVYTRLFPPIEYGSIETLIIVNSFLGALIMIGMDSAQSFYFFEQKKYGQSEQTRIISSIFQWRMVWGSIMVLVAVLLSPLLNAQLFGNQLKWEHFLISFSAALFIQVMNQNLEVYRLLYRSWVYIGLTLTYTVVSSAISITLIIIFKMGILGYFLGLLCGATLTAVWGWWRIRNYLDFTKLHTNWWGKLLKFGLPLLPASFAMYFLNTTDRWFIIHYHGQELMGIYSVAAKFAMLIYLAVYTFRRAWWPVALDTMQSQEGPELFRIMSRFYFAFATSFIVILTALSPILIRWLAAPEYHNAYPFIGILAWSAVFYGMYIIVVIGIWKKEKTIWIPVCMSIAAILNILLNYLLVPKYGGLGAALGTALSFFIWIILVLTISENLWRVGYPIKIFITQVIVGAVSSGVILFLFTTQMIPWMIIIITTISCIFLITTSVTYAQFGKMFDYVRAIIYEKNTRN